MASSDDTDQLAEDSAPIPPTDEARTDSSGSGVLSEGGEEQAPVRDLGSLAIGGTVGGLLAARALRGAASAGAKSLAAGYLAKRLRESREADALLSAQPAAAPSPEPSEPAPPLPPTPPQPSALPQAPIANEIPLVEPSLPPVPEVPLATVPSLPPPVAPEGLVPASVETEVDPDELLEPSVESSELPLEPDRDVEAEAIEAENELEEALVLMADGSGEEAAPAIPQDRRILPETAESKALDQTAAPRFDGEATTVRSPFLRDHNQGEKLSPDEEEKKPQAEISSVLPVSQVGETLFPAQAPQSPVAESIPTAPASLPGPGSLLPAAAPAPPAELPQPVSHLPLPRQVEVQAEPEVEAPQIPQQPLPAFEPAPVPAAAPEQSITQVPLQPPPAVKDESPPPPAAPIKDMALAPRPALTGAELAAKERADKLAKKKAAKGKSGKKAAKPKKSAKAKTKKQPKPKAKSKRTGTKRRLLLVALPMVLVLGGAGMFAYLNKEKLGIGGAPEGTSSSTPADVASTGSEAGKSETKSPVVPKEIFETSGHTLPGAEAGDDRSGREVAPLDEPPPAIQFTDKELKGILTDPKRTLEAFLLAGTVEDLLHFVADRKLVEPEIRAYYKNGKRTPIATQDIRFDSSGIIEETNFAAYQYWVTSLRRQIPVSVEETAGGYRVDWAAFTQFHDGLLEKFLRNPESEAGEFYVLLLRSHYFGNDVPDIDDLHAFRLQSPIAPFLDAHIFLKKSSPKAKAILERYRWSTGYRPFVRVKWETPEGGDPRVELVDIVRHKWRR